MKRACQWLTGAIAVLAIAGGDSLPAVAAGQPLVLQSEKMGLEAGDAIAQAPSKQEADRIQQSGLDLYQVGDLPGAIQSWQTALKLYRQLGDRQAEALTLYSLGSARQKQQQFDRALAEFEQALAIFRQLDDAESTGATLNRLGESALQLQQYQQALGWLQQAQTANEAANATPELAKTLQSLAKTYEALGQPEQAKTAYEQSLTVGLASRDRARAADPDGLQRQAETLDRQAEQLEDNRSSPQAETDLQAIEALVQAGDRDRKQGQYPQALKTYQQALKLAQQGNGRDRNLRNQIQDIHNQMGGAYHLMGRYPQAIETYQKGLNIAQELGNLQKQGQLLQNMGISAARAGNDKQAITLFQQTAAIYNQLGYRALEGETLDNIGLLLARQKQPELAIVFYKRAIAVLESVRQDLRILPPEKQTVFPQAFASTYRALADLLLAQGRVSEAHEVLDLLKFQELDDYLRTVRSSRATQQGITTQPQESAIWQEYRQIAEQPIQAGKELAQLRKIPFEQRTDVQKQRIAEIESLMQDLRQNFNLFLDKPEVTSLVQQLNQTTGGQNLDLPNLNRLQRQLQQADRPAALLYPLILDDRLELVLVTPYTPPLRRTVSVSRRKLQQTIGEVRAALTDRDRSASNTQTAANQLYRWLIQPLEQDLAQANIQTIVYAPDGQLRYLPLAALHDGKQWLVERFRINHITAASLTDLTTPLLKELNVLAAAFTSGTYEVNVGTRQFTFDGLAFAEPEVTNIASKIPATTTLFDTNFSSSNLVPRMNDYTVVHLATHAAFVPGDPEDSFILYGSGEQATLRDVGTWNLTAVDLVVLSACQTAVGGQLGDGAEILGLGYQMQQAGALATVASLWIVDDEGTQLLMNRFYEHLQNRMPIAEALRQAQLALIRGQHDHPYYWSPFILIGGNL